MIESNFRWRDREWSLDSLDSDSIQWRSDCVTGVTYYLLYDGTKTSFLSSAPRLPLGFYLSVELEDCEIASSVYEDTADECWDDVVDALTEQVRDINKVIRSMARVADVN